LVTPLPADDAHATTVLLTVDAFNCAWALPSTVVASVAPFDSEPSEPMVDVLGLLGTAIDLTETARLLVLQVNGVRLPLVARGNLLLTHVRHSELLPLPQALVASCPLVSHVALVEGKPALLVLSPERLLRAQLLSREPSLAPSQYPEVFPC
jgi:hypothetical protein